ncbi:MAG: hypothetical protein FJ291_23780 [Planctomycetes bacterium]|nr:hypothetical protein [Planctomycetota bacterium]
MGARSIFVGIGALVLAAVAPVASGGEPFGPPPPSEHAEAERQLNELFQDISTINLLNGLLLSRKQVQDILTLAREADERRKGGKNSPFGEGYRKALTEAQAAYAAFKAEANKGEPPGERLSQRALHYENLLKDLRNRRAELIDQAMPELDAKLRGILTEAQLQIIETFRPCLVPPRDLKDPVRAGQAESDRGVEMLSHFRNLPAPLWRDRQGEMADRYVARLGHGRLEITDEKVRAAEKQRFIALVAKARAMSDTEFEMEKAKLAAQLDPQVRLGQIVESASVVRDKGRPRDVSRAARWLLSPRIIPILEERLGAKKAS